MRVTLLHIVSLHPGAIINKQWRTNLLYPSTLDRKFSGVVIINSPESVVYVKLVIPFYPRQKLLWFCYIMYSLESVVYVKLVIPFYLRKKVLWCCYIMYLLESVVYA